MMNSIMGIAKKDIKILFREKGTVFWTIAFPVMILLLFTAIFGREIPFNANIGVVNYDDDPYGISASVVNGLNNTGFLTVKNFTDENEALEELNATNIRAVLVIPQNFSQNLYTENASVSLILDGTNPDVYRVINDGIKTFF